jgi:hypothetical protein
MMTTTLNYEQTEMLEKIKEVAETIELLKLIEGIETFRITQISDKFGVSEILVHNLSFEIDENEKLGTWIMASDLKNRILNSNSPLMAFLPESILAIDEFKLDNGYDVFCIKFDGVIVYIEATDIPHEE